MTIVILVQILADASVDLVVVVVDFTCSCCGCCRFILSGRRMEMEHGPTPRPWQRDSHNTSLLSGVDAVRSVALPHTNEQKKSDKYSGRSSSSCCCCCCCMGPALPVQFWWGGGNSEDQMMLMSGLFIINKSTWASKNIFVQQQQQSNGAR